MHLYIFAAGYLSVFFFPSFPSFLPFFVAFPRFFNNIRIPSQPPHEPRQNIRIFIRARLAFYPRRRPIKRLYRRNKPMNPPPPPPPIRIFRGVFREECDRGFRIYWQRVGDRGTIDINDESQERMNCTRPDRLKNYQRRTIISRQIVDETYIYKFQEFKDRRVHVFVES